MTDFRLELEVERSGGFGGLRLAPRTLDAADLSPQAARELAELVAAAERAPQRTSPSRSLPDATHYDITIRRGGQVRRLSFDDATAPPEVRRLLERIESEGLER
jgi:hypothetical protein